jgi:hypothetical protein
MKCSSYPTYRGLLIYYLDFVFVLALFCFSVICPMFSVGYGLPRSVVSCIAGVASSHGHLPEFDASAIAT